MSFDCSRFTFNAWNDFLGVVMQQGRVQLDADWNEFVAQILRRIQTGTLDTSDKPVVPRGTPDGFRIAFNDGKLTIGVGRMYVDGVLVENHGKRDTLRWDSQLTEQVGIEAIDYMNQPYYYPSELEELPREKPFLVYLDVWQREVTHLQYPELVEKAVGVDTTARLQTVWQVKLVQMRGDCSTLDAKLGPDWREVIRPSAARLTTKIGNIISSEKNPCRVPPAGGYTGLENQLYRIEIHDKGIAGKATFKWSRDNGAVQSLVSQINADGDRLVVDSIGRDKQLRFSEGDWVEITNRVLELRGEPGIMRKISGVDDVTRTIVLTQTLLPNVFPTDSTLQTRIRRWNQSGQIKRADGTVFHDLNESNSANPGVIPIPPAGTELFLEEGILVKFDLEGSGGNFHVGDHWSFAARTADAKIDHELELAPPLGTHHHYARLAIVKLPSSLVSDCRLFWPPEPVAGTDCVCDVCVTPEGHASGSATIQMAIGSLGEAGGVICLAAGLYHLQDPLNISGVNSLIIRGKGRSTVLSAGIIDGQLNSVIQIQDSQNVTLEDFMVVGAGPQPFPRGLITARDTRGLKLDGLALRAPSLVFEGISAAVVLDGYTWDMSVQQCIINADIGITGGRSKEKLLLTSNLSFADNVLVCNSVGLQLDKRFLHYGITEFTRNLVLAERFSAVIVLGGVLPGSSFRIHANSLRVAKDGDVLIAAVGGLHITDNEICGGGGARGKNGNGIVLDSGLDPSGIDHVWITGNRLTKLPGMGIEVRTPLVSAIIKQNIVEHARGGIIFLNAGEDAHLSIDNNQLLNIAEDSNFTTSTSLVGIQVSGAGDVEIVGNILSKFAQKASRASDCVGIRVTASENVRISGNHLSEIGPKNGSAGYVAAIEIQPPYIHATVSENILSRSASRGLENTDWQAIRIVPPTEIRGETEVKGAFFSAVGVLEIFTKEGIYFLSHERLRLLKQTRSENLLIRANQGTAHMIGGELVVAQGSKHCILANCIFSDNYFASTAVGRSLGLAELGAGAVIVSSNRLHWTGNQENGYALNIWSKAYTIIGNITGGSILINNSVLDKSSPWYLLNISAS